MLSRSALFAFSSPQNETVPDLITEFSGYSTLSIALPLRFDLPSCVGFSKSNGQRPMSKAILFDLDSCLAAADEVGDVRTGVCGHPRG